MTLETSSFRSSGFRAAAVLALAAVATPLASADDSVLVIEEADTGASRISGVVGVDLYSHFVSYGFDVWGAGSDAFSGDETLNPYAEIGVDLGNDLSLALGVWWDVNNNATDTLGGDVQETDFYIGLSKSIDKFSVGVTYQTWLYGGINEQILDVSIGYDDSELWGDSGFSLSPSLTIHNRIGGEGLEKGTVLVLGGEYGIDTGESPVSLSVPVSIAYVVDDDYFRAGGDSGLAFYSVGLGAGYGLGELIGPEYGDWSLNAGVTLYITEEDVYANPEDTFLVYNLGISMAF